MSKFNPFTLTLLSFLLSATLTAQTGESSKKREIYISKAGFSTSNFGFQYKASPNGKLYFRLGVVDAGLSYVSYRPVTTTTYPSSSFTLSLDIEAGIEFRKQLTDRLSIYTGVNLLAGGHFDREILENPLIPVVMQNIDTYIFSPGLSFESGVLFRLKDGFMLGGEIAPRLLTQFRFVETQTDYNSSDYTRHSYLNMNFDTESVRVSLVYQWDK